MAMTGPTCSALPSNPLAGLPPMVLDGEIAVPDDRGVTHIDGLSELGEGRLGKPMGRLRRAILRRTRALTARLIRPDYARLLHGPPLVHGLFGRCGAGHPG